MKYNRNALQLPVTEVVMDKNLDIIEVNTPQDSPLIVALCPKLEGKNLRDLYKVVTERNHSAVDISLRCIEEALETGKNTYFEISFISSVTGIKYIATADVIHCPNNILFCSVDPVPEKDIYLRREFFINDVVNRRFNKMNSGVIVRNERGRFAHPVFYNTRFHEMFECLPDTGNFGYWDVEKSESYDSMLIEGLQSNLSYDLTVTRTNGTLYGIFEVKKHYLRTPGGGFSIITTVNDVTKIRREIEILNEEKLLAERAERVRNAFLSNITHEIRTPLNAILGFSSIIADEELTQEDRKELSSYINDSTESLLNIVNNILTLTRLDVFDAKDFINEWFSLNALFKNFYHNFLDGDNYIPEGVKLVYDENNAYSDLEVLSDRQHIQQVLRNFVSNGLKYTTEGTVKMGYEYRNNGLYIYVKDTGVGIPSDAQEIVFNKFEKLDAYQQGTGIGLAICKAIVDSMNGRIGVESELNKGSLFYAWFPAECRGESVLKPRFFKN
ncbi:MAG: HAMP domain-containing histidine kinase [Bacteroidaceae bacterium]|nr:HAMP domain-containing histidine kinase [Bacteroidaceae bacterium]